MKKKVLASVLSAAMVATMFAGCGSSSSAAPASSAASAPRTSFGTARPASTETAGLHTPTAGAAPSAAQTADLREKLNHPVQPRATVRQEDIKVPDFLKSKQL